MFRLSQRREPIKSQYFLTLEALGETTRPMLPALTAPRFTPMGSGLHAGADLQWHQSGFGGSIGFLPALMLVFTVSAALGWLWLYLIPPALTQVRTVIALLVWLWLK